MNLESARLALLAIKPQRSDFIFPALGLYLGTAWHLT